MSLTFGPRAKMLETLCRDTFKPYPKREATRLPAL